MRSFAVISGFAAAANAYAYGYPAVNATSAAAPSSSPAAGYPVHVASSMVPVHDSYSTKVITTQVTTVCSTPGTVTIGKKTYTVSTKTTIIDDDCEITTTVPMKPSSMASSAPMSNKASSTPGASSARVSSMAVSSMAGSSARVSSMAASSAARVSSMASMPPHPVMSTPARNATTVMPTGARPSSTKPSVSEFTGGAAATAGAGMMAVIAAAAAFL